MPNDLPIGPPPTPDADPRPSRTAWLFGAFHRVTSTGRYIPEVDGLRFLAIASVFFFHLRAYIGNKSSVAWAGDYHDDWLSRLTHLGNAGVPLFFMISGFILSLPFASHRLRGTEPVRLRAYFTRRLTRLEPPYLLSLTAFFLLLRVVNRAPWSRIVPSYLESAFYLHNLVGDESNVINGVAWSLEVEVQFYILAPLLALVFAVSRTSVRRLLIVAAAVAAAVGQWFWIDLQNPGPESLLNYLQYFLAGFLLADVFLVEFCGRTGLHCGPGGGVIWDACGVVALALAGWLWSDPNVARFTAPILFMLTAVSAFQGRWVRGVLSYPWVTAVGGMCYSIYLIHYQMISLVGRFTKDLPISHHFWVSLLAQSVVVGLPTLAASALFFILVEKPCMRKDWPARLLDWVRRAVAPARARKPSEVTEVG
jgi:peptidoglycan/LPS O-acetylase OafA/YrhL